VTVAVVPDTEPARNHSWGEPKTILPHESPDGNERTDRVCSLCSMVKITVHPGRGFPWRAWRTKDGKLWVGDATPPCLGAAG
jgi:hypothetical protein